MLPGREGVEIVKHLRSKGIKTPILLLTAKSSVNDRLEGLDAGADDYLVKPFSTEELLARIRALGRRPHDQLQEDTISVSGVELQPLKCKAVYNKKRIKLTTKEAQLLELFMRNAGKVITRDQILDRVWGLDSDVEMNNVEIYIYYLRKKLEPLKHLIKIDTIRGAGYCLRECSD